MPFKSQAQIRAMFAKNPALARAWIKKYGVPANLPERLHTRKAAERAAKKRREQVNRHSRRVNP